jgi:hypothetical protein
MLDARHREALRERPGLYEALETERAMQETLLQMMQGHAIMWLLTMDDGSSVCPLSLTTGG